MASLRGLLAPLSEPLGPRLRETVLRALRRLPCDVSVGAVTLEGTRLALTDVVLSWSSSAGDARVEARRVVLGLHAQGWLVRDQSELCLEALEGIFELHPTAPLLPFRAELRFQPSGRTERWVDGHAFLEGGGLALSSAVKVSASELTLGELRLCGLRTDLRGKLALGLTAPRQLTATLAGRLGVGALPLASFVPVASLAVDLREVDAQVSLELEGPVARGVLPDARLTVDVVSVPLRAPGQPRFLPHLRVERGHGEALVRDGRITLSAELEPNGGGSLGVVAELRGALGGVPTTPTTPTTTTTTTAPTVRATVRDLAPSTLQLALDLAGTEERAPRVALRGAPLSGLVEVEGPHLHAELTASAVTLDLDGASFPLDAPRLVLDGAVRTPDLRLEASIDAGSLLFTRRTDGALALQVRGAGARLLARLAAMDPAMPPLTLAGEPTTPGAIVVPRGLRVDLDARPARDALSADLTLEGEGSRLVIHLDALDALHRASRVVGHITLAHASLLIDLPRRAPGVSLTGAPLALDLSLLGSSTLRDQASIAGTLSLGSATASYGGRALTLGPASVHVHSAPTWLAFDTLDLQIGRGALRGAGVITLGRAAPCARVHLVCDDVRLGRSELFPEGPPLDGRAFAHAWFTLSGSGLEHVQGELRARVERPRYTFLTAATASLGRLGLPPVPTEGDAALEAHAVLEGGKLRVRSLRASVPGLRASGRGDVNAKGGRLHAELALVVDRAWLAQRALYAVPGAVLGRVDLPISLRGSLARPEARAEIARAVLKSLTRSLGERRAATALALGPRSLEIPDAPLSPEEAARVRTLVRGALPLDALTALAARFVEGALP